MKHLFFIAILLLSFNLFASTEITEINPSELSSSSLSTLFENGVDIYRNEACRTSQLKENHAKTFMIDNKSKKSHEEILNEIIVLNTTETVINSSDQHYTFTSKLRSYSTFVTNLENVTDECNDVIVYFLGELESIKSRAIKVYNFKTDRYAGFFVYKPNKKEALLFF